MALKANINFITSNETFRQLFGNGVSFRVPSFQCDYSWTQDNWSDLWQDIARLRGTTDEDSHYMGYLVFQTKNSKEFVIIDGQQRLTTFTIIILAGLSIFKELANRGIDAQKNDLRREQLQRNYIAYLDPVTLIPQSKLALNRHNDRYFQHYLVPLQEPQRRGLNSSERLLANAFEWFRNILVKEFGQNENSGQKLVEFIESLADRVFFTVIRVNEELNAFKVFETLNARRVRLSATDLLKNHLFSIIETHKTHENEIRTLEEKWENILNYIADIGEDLPEFLRLYWNSKNKLVRKNELFKIIRNNIKDRKDVFNILRDLEHGAEIYSGLKDYYDNDLWNEKEKKNLELLKIFDLPQPFSLLLACHDKFYTHDRDLFSQILDDIVIFSFRYNIICNKQTIDQEIVYNTISQKVSSGIYTRLSNIRSDLDKLYPDDRLFQQDFKIKSFNTLSPRNSKIVKYILANIEKQESGIAARHEKPVTIEHILPMNGADAWQDITEREQKKLVYRIGNMALLEKKLNIAAGNNSFDYKKELYMQSAFRTTRAIAEHHDKWDREDIDSRQAKLAKIACGIWRFRPLSGI